MLGLCALAVGGGVLHGGNAGRLTLAVAFGAAMTLPLLGRRRAPLAAATAVFVATWLSPVVLGESGAELGGWIAYVLATYAVGAHPDGRRAVLGLLLSTVPATAWMVIQLRAGEDPSEMVQPVLVLVAVWVAGRISARRQHRAELVEHRAAQVESGAADIAREAAERERSRIARELHDVVTHGMTVMVVQAQAAQTLAGSDTDRARDAMRAVEDAGRTALVEMRRLLGVIRSDGPVGEPGDRAPQPRLDDLPGLVRAGSGGGPPGYLLHRRRPGARARRRRCLRLPHSAGGAVQRRPARRRRPGAGGGPDHRLHRRGGRAERAAHPPAASRARGFRGRASRGCGSGSRSSTDGWRPGRRRAADSPSTRPCRWGTGEHPGPGRRRPGAGAGGFRVLLDAEPDLEVVGEAGDGCRRSPRRRALRPDVVLMDIRMPRLDGIGATAVDHRPLPGPGARADHLRPRRVRLRRAAGRRLRLPAQGRGAGRARPTPCATVADGGALLAPTVTCG